MTWNAPSVVSWSARNERSSREESSNFESYQFEQQIEQQRSMQQHMQWMQQQETLRSKSQERQSRQERPAPVQVSQQRQERQESVHQESVQSKELTQKQERSTSRKGARTVIDILRHNKEEKQEKEAASSAATLKKTSLARKEAAEVTQIPVKNYRSRTLSRSGHRREPSPPVDYPAAGAEYSDDTDETTDVRIAEYEASHGGRGRSMRRKASTQSFSKKTSVTRNYPGCVIA